MKSILVGLGILAALSGHAYGVEEIGNEYKVNLPMKKQGLLEYEIFSLQMKTGLLSPSAEFVGKFRTKLESDLATYEKALPKKQKFLIKELLARLDVLSSLPSGGEGNVERVEVINQIIEIAQVYYYMKHTIADADLAKLPMHPFFRGYIHPYWMNLQAYDVWPKRGLAPINLRTEVNRPLEQIDPVDSSFWTKREDGVETYLTANIQNKWCNGENVFLFDKQKNPPEEGGGANPGVKVYTDDGKDKDYYAVKLGMSQHGDTAVFQTQEGYYETGINSIYWALGYNVDRGIFCPGIKLQFTPDFLDLSDSKTINPNLWALGHFYKSFILNDGREIEFKEAMASRHYIDHSGVTNGNIDGVPVSEYSLKPQFEGKIAYIMTHAVYLEKRSKKQERMIRWERDGVSHEDRREIRGLLVLDSWLGAMDNYGFNLKLLFEKNKNGGPSLMKFTLVDNGHTFAAADVDMDTVQYGGGYLPLDLREFHLKADWVGYKKLYDQKYRPLSDLEVQTRRFGWSMFNDGSDQKRLDLDLPLAKLQATVSADLHGLNNHRAKRYIPHVTLDDLRWMTRKIALLQEWQIYHALAQTGLGHPGAKLMTEKLISRRDQLVTYFGLDTEFPMLRPQGPDKALNVSGTNVVVVDGVEILVPSYDYKVVAGELFVK